MTAPALTIADMLELRPIAFTTGEVTEAEQTADLLSTVQLDPYVPGDDSWVKRARCGDSVDPELFHPLTDLATMQIEQAVEFCRACPVKRGCRMRRYDIGAVGSVWGGVYYGTKARGKRPCAYGGCTKAAVNPQNGYCGYEHEHAVKVGTSAGYSLHLRAQVDVCPACADARQRDALKYRDNSSSRGVRGSAGAKSYQGPPAGRRVAA